MAYASLALESHNSGAPTRRNKRLPILAQLVSGGLESRDYQRIATD
jgi:hypothetical protein